jgi:hypothetical protein
MSSTFVAAKSTAAVSTTAKIPPAGIQASRLRRGHAGSADPGLSE